MEVGRRSESPRQGVTVTTRVLAILAAFDDRHRALTLTEVAARAELTLPTAHRLVAELVAWGALVRGPDHTYGIGRRLWDLGRLVPGQSGISEIASPYLHDLHAATKATVHLAVREDTSVLYLDRISGSSSVPVVSRVGTRLPLHATGVGKVLLAFAPTEVQQAVLGSLTRITPYTIVQPAKLARELAAVRQNGVARTREEMSLGANSHAVAVVVDGEVVAALGVVVLPTLRHPDRLVAAMQVAARGIGRSLSLARPPG